MEKETPALTSFRVPRSQLSRERESLARSLNLGLAQERNGRKRRFESEGEEGETDEGKAERETMDRWIDGLRRRMENLPSPPDSRW
jgi:hypothetical protein